MQGSRRAQVPPFAVMAILEQIAAKRAAGWEVHSLCAGEPSGGAPSDVQALAAELHGRRHDLGYTPTLGISDLRLGIAGHYRRWYGVEVDPEAVAVTTGASGAFVLLFLTAFDAGDRVAVARPGYPAYRNLLRSLGIEVVELPVGVATGFQPTVEHLDAAVAHGGPLQGLVLASPANPTGSMVDRTQLRALADWCADHGARLISDEIYHGITHPPDRAAPGARGASALELDPSAVVVSSFSKYWGMTGWRIGWAVLPEDLRAPVEALAGNLALCPPAPAQLAAVAAFTERSYAEAEARVDDLARARQHLLASLDRLGWGPVAPAAGAFYLWAGIGAQLGRHGDAVAWCRALLEEADVALVPGTDADPVDGGGFVRASFAAGLPTIRAAVDRIVDWQQRG